MASSGDEERARSASDRLRRAFPILKWARGYDRRWLTPDLVAGITVGTFAVPECLAYASLAGLPLQVGLYAEISALGIYMLMGTSRTLSVGTTSALSILVGSTLGAMAIGNADLYWAYASLTALFIGLFALGAYVLRMGFIVKLISNPVLTGFTAGAAFYIASSQMAKVVGVQGGGGNFFDRMWDVVSQLGSLNVYALALGIGGLAFLFVMGRVSRRTPASIILVAASILIVTFADLRSKGVRVEGGIPLGLPVPGLPDAGALSGDTIGTLLTLAVACLLLAYIEGVGIARAYVQKDGERLDTNQELMALSGMNLASGLTQGFSVGGSVSRSAVNHQSGAKTQLASGFAALIVVVVVLFLAPLFSNLPEAALGAIVIYAIAHLVDIKELRRIFSISKRHFAVAMVAFATVLLFGLLVGIVVGIILSTLNLLERIYRPHTARLGLEAVTCKFEDVRVHRDATELPGIYIYRVDAPLVFMNSESVRDGAQNLVLSRKDDARMLIIDLENCYEVDITALDMLRELWKWTNDRGVDLRISNASDKVWRTLTRAGMSSQFHDASRSIHWHLREMDLACPRDEG